MPDQSDLILEQLKTLQEDVKEITSTLNQFKGSMEARVEHLCTAVENLRAGDDALHRRVDKKDERIRELEKRQHEDEQSFTRLETKIETTNKTNRFWILGSAAVTTAVATAAAVLVAILLRG